MASAPPSLKSLAIKNITLPVVVHGFITKWNLLNWGLEDWANKFGDRVLPFRVSAARESKVNGQPVWERDCSTEFMTFKQFLEWESGPEGQARNKWMYFDYKYMHEWFEGDHDFLKAVDWGCMGFDGRHGRESTLWIGCHGAHTPCHADTYGFNLVAQLYGRKRWLLFPPNSEKILQQASRVPYEESSIYVDGSVGGGQGGARGVILSPGDVLVVPKRWWHRVDTEGSISISVNTWIPSDDDDIARVEESLVRFIFATAIESLPSEWRNSLLNPNEDDLPSMTIVDHLHVVKHTVQTCKSQNHESNALQPLSEETNCHLPQSPPQKRMKRASEKEDMSSPKESGRISVNVVPLVGSEGWLSWDPESVTSTSKSDLCDDDKVLQKILNSFCHPEVISLVRKKMLQSTN